MEINAKKRAFRPLVVKPPKACRDCGSLTGPFLKGTGLRCAPCFDVHKKARYQKAKTKVRIGPRVCRVCGSSEKPFSETYGNRCEPCAAAYKHEHYLKHRDRYSVSNKEWALENADKVTGYRQKYYEDNREEIKARAAAYAETHADSIKEYHRLLYLEDSAPYKARAKKRRGRLMPAIQEFLNEAKDIPCLDCGLRFPPAAMDFDHLRDKVDSVGMLVSGVRPLEDIKAEIAKCELVCACCHRIRTKARSGAFRHRASSLAHTIDDLRKLPCMDCEKTFPPEAMDFDHRDPTTKEFNVGSARTWGKKQLPRVMAEIAKCDLVCACCHRVRTFVTKRKAS